MLECILPSKERCDKWIQTHIHEAKCQNVGFDSESRSSSGVLALIQIATPISVMIYRVYEIPIKDWPVKLIELLQDEKITKYCVDIRQDIELLNKIGLKPASFVDLQIEVQKTLNTTKRLGFKTLLKTLLGVDFNKSKSIQCSNWSKLPLTQKQIEYACDDAIGCLALAEKLKLYESPVSILETPEWKSRYSTKFIDPSKSQSRLEQLESVLVDILRRRPKEEYILLSDLMSIPELYFTLDNVEQIISGNNKKRLELHIIEGDHYIRIRPKSKQDGTS